MHTKWLVPTALALFLIACNDDTPVEDEVVEQPIEQEQPAEETPLSWSEQVTALAADDTNADDKLYTLEPYMADYKATMPEIELFQANVKASYEDGSYIATPSDHEQMLTLIFQAYVLKTHVKNEQWQAFLQPYYENITSVYRMLEEPTSEKIVTNEAAMADAFEQLPS